MKTVWSDIAMFLRRLPVVLVICAAVTLTPGCFFRKSIKPELGAAEEQITFDYKPHCLNSHQCFSPDDEWIVYDTRAEPGSVRSAGIVEKVNVKTGQMIVMYRCPNQTRHGPGAGAAAYNPVRRKVLFSRGLLNSNYLRPTGFRRRGGVVVHDSDPLKAIVADARDVTPPFTPGALRGGTYGHSWSADGKWVSFIYHDAVLDKLGKLRRRLMDLRTVGVSASLGEVKVDSDPDGENSDGTMYTVQAVRVTPNPTPGSDQIVRAYNQSWVGDNGYVKPDGTRQKRAIAFQGIVLDSGRHPVAEVFIADLPDRLDAPGSGGPLAGTATTGPEPPKGVVQRRLTFDTTRKHPGIQGPQHWLRSSPDGKWIAFLAKDDRGVAQIHLVSPNGGKDVQLTRNKLPVASAFNWSPDGRYIAYAMDNSIFVTDARQGETFGRSMRMTDRSSDDRKPLPHAVVWSNRGDKIAFCRRIKYADKRYSQIFVVKLRRK